MSAKTQRMGKDVACPRNAARLLVAGWVVRPWRSSQPGKSLGCYAKEPEFTLQVLKKHLQFLPAEKKKNHRVLFPKGHPGGWQYGG